MSNENKNLRRSVDERVGLQAYVVTGDDREDRFQADITPQLSFPCSACAHARRPTSECRSCAHFAE